MNKYSYILICGFGYFLQVLIWGSGITYLTQGYLNEAIIMMYSLFFFAFMQDKIMMRFKP